METENSIPTIEATHTPVDSGNGKLTLLPYLLIIWAPPLFSNSWTASAIQAQAGAPGKKMSEAPMGVGVKGDILQLCSRAPKLMTHWGFRMCDLVDTPLLLFLLSTLRTSTTHLNGPNLHPGLPLNRSSIQYMQ